MLSSLNLVRQVTRTLTRQATRTLTRQATRVFRKSSLEETEVACTVPIWTQYKTHKAVFEIAKKKMKDYNFYYNPFKSTLKEFEDAAGNFKKTKNSELLTKLYSKVWRIMFNFFCSKEYLSSYNPMFLQTKGGQERENIIGKLFEIKQIDLDKEFYEILLHLLYKQLLSEKYENLTNLQRIIRIERKWRSYLKVRNS